MRLDKVRSFYLYFVSFSLKMEHKWSEIPQTSQKLLQDLFCENFAICWFVLGNDYLHVVRGASEQLVIITSTTLVSLIMMTGSAKVASTDTQEAVLRELTAGNIQTRNEAAQYQWNRRYRGVIWTKLILRLLSQHYLDSGALPFLQKYSKSHF